MTELEEFGRYLEGLKGWELADLHLSELISDFYQAKRKPKGVHGDCYSNEHAIGAGYCPVCQP